jgi:hypothetical protein
MRLNCITLLDEIKVMRHQCCVEKTRRLPVYPDEIRLPITRRIVSRARTKNRSRLEMANLRANAKSNGAKKPFLREDIVNNTIIEILDEEINLFLVVQDISLSHVD